MPKAGSYLTRRSTKTKSLDEAGDTGSKKERKKLSAADKEKIRSMRKKRGKLSSEDIKYLKGVKME